MGNPVPISVGTTPIRALEYNLRRTSLRVQFLSTAVFAGNLGVVSVGVGIVPDAAVGNPTMRDVLTPGQELSVTEQYPGDPTVSEDEVYLVADRAGQLVIVEEDAFDPLIPERTLPVTIVGDTREAAARIPARTLPTPRVEHTIGEQLPYGGKIPAERLGQVGPTFGPTGGGPAPTQGPAPTPGPSPPPPGPAPPRGVYPI